MWLNRVHSKRERWPGSRDPKPSRESGSAALRADDSRLPGRGPGAIGVALSAALDALLSHIRVVFTTPRFNPVVCSYREAVIATESTIPESPRSRLFSPVQRRYGRNPRSSRDELNLIRLGQRWFIEKLQGVAILRFGGSSGSDTRCEMFE